MKRNIKLLSFLALSFVVILSSCKKDEPTAEEKKIEELKGTWNIVGANVLDEALSGVSITFTVENTTYAVTGLQAFADANLNHNETLSGDGTFSLNDNLDVVSLSPGGDLTIASLNKDNGNLTLSYEAPFPKGTDDPTNITLTLEFVE
ncbi:hypothetical protein MATR_26460 [Marivirga tractuosa]|uniref:Lipocalin-like domain-containing protein n=1 Tax=Marivirga tractuosa (strain ATCC 23168 / DSM 4126 / NBRC 15989 / NCIMB 1408 / VKM B-1430 / H-43) TaxID=643867 RepID=E4TNB2_MARTH|nr:hypothetical protein [Marivirga tractuosa]ADR23500.1 hypothetical protein Ftrac_3530 [Marivirga tractuosa DSM 4126]BDD15821.1 hypothetical protein MATR_26460 [Marivirga tractuosa]